jgi:Zn-dependent protease with chaperone function
MRCIRWSVVVLFSLLATGLPGWALSLEDEVRLGKQVMEEVRPLGLTADESLQPIGERLAGVVTRKDLPWCFWVIEDWKTYNAFAAPGGFVFITRVYYEKLSDDEAAFVLGHEMSHIDLNHYQKQLRRARQADIGHLLLNILVQSGATWQTATDIGATAYMTHYSRALEKEADLTGYQYAKAAGYDANLAVTALSKLGERPEGHPWIVNIYGTHPLLSSREDRLAALGETEPEEITVPEPSPQHKRDLTGGLEPFDPPVPIAIRILAPEGKRWENAWRKNFTKRLHLRLTPHGFTIAGDDLMYKPDIGDPVEAARSRNAKYLLLVTVKEMSSVEESKSRAPSAKASGPAGVEESEGSEHEGPGGSSSSGRLSGAPVSARVDVVGRLVVVGDGSQVWEGRFAEQRECTDVLPVDKEILYTDTCLGSLVDQVAGEIAQACAKAAGAEPAKPKPEAPK